MRFLLYLCALLAIAEQAHADEAWVDFYNSAPFHYRSEFQLDGRQDLFREIDLLKSDVELILDLKGSDNAIQLNLFRTNTSYWRYVSQRIPEGMTRRALYVKGPDMGRVYVQRSSKLETDLRHEATHALLHNMVPYLPMWLDEGIAEYFEVPRQKRAFGNTHLRSLRWAIRFGWRPSLTELEKSRDLSEMKRLDYRNSWAWVHFLLHESPESRKVLIDYLNDIKFGNPPGPFSDRVRNRIPNVEARMLAHFKNWMK